MLFSYGLAKEAFYNQVAYAIVIYPLTYYYEAIGSAIVFYVFWLLLVVKIYKDKKFRVPRVWSNRELEKFGHLFSGKGVNVSGWKVQRLFFKYFRILDY